MDRSHLSCIAQTPPADIDVQDAKVMGKEYMDLGFELCHFNNLFVLKHKNKVFFIMGDDYGIKHGLARVLCNTYLDSRRFT